MKLCGGCDRHIRSVELECPFCGLRFRTVAASLGDAAKTAIVGMCVGLGAVGCGPRVGDGNGGGSDGTSGSGTSPTTEATMTGPSTTSSGTSGSTLDDGLTMTTVDSSADDDSTDASDDGAGGFYATPPDVGMSGLECDVFAQDCPADTKCMPWADDGGTVFNATHCTPIAPGAGTIDAACTVEGSPASGIDDCELGLLCVTDDEATLTGQCEALCDTDGGDPGCAPDETCTALVPGSRFLPDLGICTA